MKPILFAEDEITFDSNGVGILSDAIDCDVIQVLNGTYELEMIYPVKGIHFKQIKQRSIILAKPDPVTDPQPFRIYRTSKPMSGKVTCYARHVAYDMMGIPVSRFTAEGVTEALTALKDNATEDCPFDFWTDKDSASAMELKKPMAMWSLLGGTEGSVLDTFGGEYEFNRWFVRLWNSRGADRGVSIRYGKNLTSLQQDENCAGCYTGVYPYWSDTNGNYVELTEKTVNAPGTFSYSRIFMLDLSAEWQEQPTEDQLRERAEAYISSNDIGTPEISWKVEFVQLEQTEEYKGKALLERVLIGDTVAVEFPDMGISARARAVEVRYKPILNRYENITLGKVRSNIADIVVKQQKELDRKPSETSMQKAVQALTSSILGAKGGAVRHLDTDGDGYPDTLYIADNPDPSQAVKVWRFNYLGWGASTAGYNGPFTLGASLENGFVADFITAGTLDANLIKVKNFTADKISAGKLISVDGKSYFDLDAGKIVTNNIVATGGTIGGCSIEDGVLKVPAANITGAITATALKVVNSSGATLLSAGDNAVVIGSWNIASNGLYNTSGGRIHLVASGNMSTAHAVGDSGSKTNWRILCGSSTAYNFGVDAAGVAYAKDIKIYGGKVKIPIDSVTGAYALIDLGGIGCYASDGTGVVMTESGLLYDGDYVMSFDSGKRLLEGTWYIGSLSSSVQVTSDRNAKYDIQDQPEVYSRLFDQLKPVTYRYKDGTSGRIHTGFIAQDVEDAVLSLGLETTDFAAVCYDLDDAGNKVRYGIRYEEIVSLNTYEIQKLKKRVADLETLIRT